MTLLIASRISVSSTSVQAGSGVRARAFAAGALGARFGGGPRRTFSAARSKAFLAGALPRSRSRFLPAMCAVYSPPTPWQGRDRAVVGTARRPSPLRSGHISSADSSNRSVARGAGAKRRGKLGYSDVLPVGPRGIRRAQALAQQCRMSRRPPSSVRLRVKRRVAARLVRRLGLLRGPGSRRGRSLGLKGG